MLQKLSYAFGNFAQGVGPAIVGGWLQYFYTKTETSVSGTVVGPGTALLAFTTFGTIAAGARLMESFANPVVGYFSDRIRTRFGRRRPFIVALTPVLALTFVGLWFPPFAVSGVGNAVWLGVTLGLFWLAFAGVVGPYLSLLPEITPYSRERIQVSTMMGYLEVAGFLAATMGAGAVIQAAASGVQLGPVNFSDGYQLLAVVVGVVILAGSLLSVRFITEKPHSAAKEVSYTFAGAIRRTFANELFLPYVAAVSLFRIGIDSVIVAIPFLVVRVLGAGEGVAGLLQGAVAVAAVLLFPLVSLLAGRHGKRAVYLAGLAGFAVGLPLLYFVADAPFLGKPVVAALGAAGVGFADPVMAIRIAHVVLVLVIIAFPVSTSFVLPRAILADVIDEDERITGFRREAMYNGTEALLSRAAAAAVPLVTTQLFATFGATSAEPLGILLVGPVAGCFVLVGAVIFRRYRSRD